MSKTEISISKQALHDLLVSARYYLGDNVSRATTISAKRDVSHIRGALEELIDELAEPEDSDSVSDSVTVVKGVTTAPDGLPIGRHY